MLMAFIDLINMMYVDDVSNNKLKSWQVLALILKVWAMMYNK